RIGGPHATVNGAVADLEAAKHGPRHVFLAGEEGVGRAVGDLRDAGVAGDGSRRSVERALGKGAVGAGSGPELRGRIAEEPVFAEIGSVIAERSRRLIGTGEARVRSPDWREFRRWRGVVARINLLGCVQQAVASAPPRRAVVGLDLHPPETVSLVDVGDREVP